jgi:aminomethyltransferase
MPLYGHELGEEINPIEAGLNWAVKLDKGDFVGCGPIQKAVEHSPRKRVGLELEGKRAAREGCAVENAGKIVGRVTSGSFGPTLQKSIAMAYVESSESGIGTQLQVDIRGDRVAATVIKLPFYQRAK